MSAIQSLYPPQFQTYEQRKAEYEKMASRRDENGNFIPRDKPIELTPVEGYTGGTPTSFQGYAIGKAGDDYVVFAMNPTINCGDGGISLTTEDIAFLREKYDMDNLSKEERIKLLAELSCMGIISGTDAYAEAYPDQCGWIKSKHEQFGINGGEMDLSKWVDYYLKRAQDAQIDMDRIVASSTGIAFFEAERRANNFYSSFARVMQQLT